MERLVVFPPHPSREEVPLGPLAEDLKRQVESLAEDYREIAEVFERALNAIRQIEQRWSGPMAPATRSLGCEVVPPWARRSGIIEAWPLI